MKKVLFILLVSVCIPWCAWAYDVEIDGIYYNLVEKAKQAEVTYGPDGSSAYSGNIVIPESIEHNGNSYAVTSIAKNAFQSSPISSIEFSNSITSIGEQAFLCCNELVSVTIPSNVRTIGNYAFYSCQNLSSVDIQYGVTNMGYYAFAYCPSLKDVTIANSVTSIEYGTFQECTGLETFTVPTSIDNISSYMLMGCTSLKTIVIPDNIQTIGYQAFKECTALTSVDIGTGVQSIYGEAFSECKNLETVYCHAQNISYTSEDAFANSYIDYATLVVPAEALDNYQDAPWNSFGTVRAFTDIAETYPILIDGIYYQLFTDGTAKVVSGDVAYIGDINIPSLVYFEGTNYVVTTIGYYAFDGDEVSSVDIPESVTTIEEGAFRCSFLTSIHIPANVSTIVEGAFGALNAQVESITVDENNPYFDSRNGCNAIVNTATNELVRGCKNTVIPADVTSIGNEAFGWCYDLTSIQIPENVTSIGEYAFCFCNSLESIRLPSNLSSIGGRAFCFSGLKSITIPSSVSSIGENAFYGCESLSFVKTEASEPLAASSETFPNSILLYVPTGCKEAYENADGWNYARKILEMASIPEKVFYLLNVETGLFLDQGNSWGTHAVLAEEGLPVRFTQLEDGRYTIYFEEGSAYDRLLFRENDSNVYVDYNPDNGNAANWCKYWTVTKGDDNNYYLQSLITDGLYGQALYPSTFLGNNPSKEAYDQDGNALGVYNDVDGNVQDGDGMNIKWKLITSLAYNLRVHELPIVIASANEVGIDTSEAQALQQDGNANSGEIQQAINALRQAINDQLPNCAVSRIKPIEVTGLVQNPSFAWNSDYGWTASEANEGGTHTLRVGESEYWNTSFNYSQTITGLANGIYQIKLKAFHRPGNNWDVLNDYQQGIDRANAMFDANNSSVAIVNQASAALEEQIDGWGTEVNGLFLPNSMEDAKRWFDAGYYENTLTVNVTDGTLDLCIRLDEEVANQWVIFDDFQLFYLGDTNQLYADEVTVRAGTQVTIPVVLVNENEFGGVQFLLTLPEGVTLSRFDKTERLDQSFQFAYNNVGDNTYQVMLFNTNRKLITGNDGELFTMTLDVNEDMAVGVYEIVMSEVTASDFDLNETVMADCHTLIHIEDFLMGDVNLDGRVNITDVMAVVNYILGYEMPVFSRKAADLKADGKINVTDVLGIVNIILTGNSRTE
ncbi:MAG: leucine-rich repeat protein [Prevotella sp.]|nr:leucine-rich repeat protein [Prevotella sp.]